MSTMDNLHRKGWLARERDGKAYRYTAVASREEYSARLMREAMAGAGDTEAVLSHFVAQMDGSRVGGAARRPRRSSPAAGRDHRAGPARLRRLRRVVRPRAARPR